MLVFRSFTSLSFQTSEDRQPFGIPVARITTDYKKDVFSAVCQFLMVVNLLSKFVNFRVGENNVHRTTSSSVGDKKNFNQKRTVTDFCAKFFHFCTYAVSMMKEHVGHLFDRSGRRQKDVNLNEVFNKLDELSPLGSTPKNQRFKGAFNIFESIAENNPLGQGMFFRTYNNVTFLNSLTCVYSGFSSSICP